MMIKKKLFIRRLVGTLAGVAILYSCASVGRIEGGPLDETPPLFLRSTPTPGALNYNRPRVRIEFDEYIKLDNPGEKVVISPPQVQQPNVRASGKRVLIDLEDTLKPNMTYTIDFSDAIQDNNEGNPLYDFAFTFSTGDHIDSLQVSGILLNAADLEPVKNMLVGLHANLEDSAFTSLPFDRVGRTDSRGRFSIRGIAPGRYRIYGLMDGDQNYYFSQPTENIAYADSLVIPMCEPAVRPDTFWIDTLTIDTIVQRGYTRFMPDDLILMAFKEKITRAQRLAKSERPVMQRFSLCFTAPADTLPLLKGMNFDATDAFIIEKPTGRIDTLDYWIKDSLIYKLDTLKMELTYLYTDTLNQLVPRTDTLALVSKVKPKTEEEKAKEREKKEKERKKRRKKGEEEEDKPGTEFLPVDVYAPSAMDIYDYLTVSFTEPIARIDTSAFHLKQKVDTLWNDIPFDFQQDTADIKKYNIFADWEPGESYTFEIDSTAIHGIYGLFTDKVKKDFKAKALEEYGQIFFDITGADSVAFVELLDGQDKVLRTVPVVEGRADFYFLNPGKYGARLINDTNGNGKWDTGDYAAKRQPEAVYYYWQVLDLKANFELRQSWNIKDRPRDKQKPDELKKQKPDEDKKNKNRNNRSSSGNSGRGYSY